MFRNVVIGYDDRENGRDALALGRAVVAADGGRRTVVHVYVPPTTIAAGTDGSAERLLAEAADEVLAAARTEAGDEPGVDHRAVRGLSRSEGLHRAAADAGADLLVVGASHRHGLGRVFAGSVTEQALHGASIPVAVAPPGYRDRPATRPRVIGVAYDGGAPSKRALEVARGLAAESGARLEIYAVADVRAPAGVAATVPQALPVLQEGARDGARAILADLPAAEAESHVELEGDPAERLVEESRSLDLLVLGSRGHGAAAGLVLGSVSSHVVRDAASPVLVVPRGD